VNQENVDVMQLLRTIAVAFAVVCGLLIMVPLAPIMPDLSLDGAWRIASNTAKAQGLVFGRDFVFTSGPYAAIYTRMYAPETDLMMLVGASFLAVAMLWVVVSSVPQHRRAWLLGLPVVMALPGMGDALFIIMPWLIVLLAAHGESHGRGMWLVRLYVSVTACALLPLIKGSFTVPAIACIGIASVIAYRTHRKHGWLLPLTFLLALVAEWCMAGQPLGALPSYFASQADVIEGYGDAMSLSGPIVDLILLLLASGLLCTAYLGAPGTPRLIWLGAMLTVFVGLKAGLVRHDDAHSATAAAVVLLVAAYAAFVMRSWVWRGVILLAALLAMPVLSRTASMSPQGMLSRTAHVIVDSAAMGIDRLNGAPLLARRYANAIGMITSLTGFPADGRTADVYSVGASLPAFSGEKWSPRPIIQSYSAYTPTLIQRNVEHLQQRGPDKVYWQLYTTDSHYPALDDGASWRWLLGGYRAVDRVSDFVVLEREANVAALPLGDEVVKAHPALGDLIALPTDSPLWVTITLKPTLLGRLRSIVFKPAAVQMITIYPDHGVSYRVVPGMMETGFLLSPTIATTNQLQAFLANGFEATPRGRVPERIALDVPGGSVWFNDHFDITVHRLRLPRPTFKSSFLDPPIETGQRFDAGGDCVMENFDGDPLRGDHVVAAGGTVALAGVVAIDKKNGRPAAGAALLVIDAAGIRHVVPARKVLRSDVADLYGPALLDSGFNALFSVERMPRPLQVSVLVSDAGRYLECQSPRLTID
jgi:hypothetical protein